jgi:hypothetical protein
MKPAWKPETGTDTDGILDRCECGARGAMRHVAGGDWVAACSDHCGNMTDRHRMPIDAATEWNKSARVTK